MEYLTNILRDRPQFTSTSFCTFLTPISPLSTFLDNFPKKKIMGVHFRDPLPRQWLRSIVNDPLLWSEKTKLKVQFLSQANYFKIIGESDTSSSVPQWSAKN